MRNLSRLDNYPQQLQEKIFRKFFEQAEIAQLSPEKRQSYEDSLKYYRDLHSVIDTAFIDGKAEGRLEASIALLSRQLTRRFGALPDWALAQLQQASEAELEHWSEAIFEASSLEQLFQQRG